MTTFYALTLTFILFALATHGFVIRVNNGTSSRSKELHKLFVTGLKSMRTETENSKVLARQIYGDILTKLSEFFDEKSDEIFDDLNKKRAAFHDLHGEKTVDEIIDCLELVGQLGRSANDAVANINECAVTHSEIVDERFDDFNQKSADKVERLDAFGIAAHKCFDSHDDELLIESCLLDATNKNSHREALYSLAMKKLQTLADTLETNLASCSYERYEAYYSSSSIFLEEARKCLQQRNSQESPIKVSTPSN